MQSYRAADEIIESIEQCGKRADPLVAGVICLPGGQHPGCDFVESLNGNEACPYYIAQPGDTFSSIADSLRLPVSSFADTNSNRNAVKDIFPGDLLKVPTWDELGCDELPETKAGLQTAKNEAEPQEMTIPSLEKNTTTTTTTTTNGTVCEAYRLNEGQTLEDIAEVLGIPVSILLTFNPDLAMGAPRQAGTIIKLDEETKCIKYEILNDSNLAEFSVSQESPSQAPMPSAVNQREIVLDAGGPRSEESTPPGYIDLTQNETITVGSDGESAVEIVVSDEEPEPYEGSGPSLAIYIMAGCLGAVFLALMVLACVALSNARKLHIDQTQHSGNQKRGEHA
eukprot:jgi/Picsp_1/5274/NSC_02636-R1_hypothetical protein CHLNCDRAFT_57799 [Chlorella variabilis]